MKDGGLKSCCIWRDWIRISRQHKRARERERITREKIASYKLIYNIIRYSEFEGFLSDFYSSIDWGCRTRRLHLCKGVNPPPLSFLNMTLNCI